MAHNPMAAVPGVHEKQSLVLAPSRALPRVALTMRSVCRFSPEHSGFGGSRKVCWGGSSRGGIKPGLLWAEQGTFALSELHSVPVRGYLERRRKDWISVQQRVTWVSSSVLLISVLRYKDLASNRICQPEIFDELRWDDFLKIQDKCTYFQCLYYL